MNDPTAIKHSNGGTILTGDAIEMYRWKVLQQAIKLYANTGMLMTRGAKIGMLMAQASEVTKKKYPKNKEGYLKAVADLQTSIDTLKAAIPVTDERTQKPNL